MLGRKNHYGSKSKRGTEVAALLYSLLETAKLCDVNPEEYLIAAVKRAMENALIEGMLDSALIAMMMVEFGFE